MSKLPEIPLTLIEASFPNGFTIRDEANAIVARSFRNGPLENLHAGKSTKLLDNPINSRITESEMKELMLYACEQVEMLLRLKSEKPDQYYQTIMAYGIMYCNGWDRGNAAATTRPSNKFAEIADALFDDSSFHPADKIDENVPDTPGFYCIRLAENANLPEPFFNGILHSRKSDYIYIGLASTSLRERFLHNELRGKGHGTFFRSIGAVLGYRPPSGSLRGKNFKFSKKDSAKLVTWINHNLIVNWVVCENADYRMIEGELIRTKAPLLNISKNPNRLKELSELRKLCKSIAAKNE